MVTIVTYAASLDKKVNIVKASVVIVAMDTIIAIVAGLIIFFQFYLPQDKNQEKVRGLFLLHFQQYFMKWELLVVF